MQKWALLIGINEYPKLGQRYHLQGCVNDVEVMAEILQSKFNFPKENITTLLDEEATQAGIRSEMQALIDRVGHDDIVVLHYSGYGSQITDVHGDEASGMDSTIVPYDSGRGGSHPNRDITDDEIHVWLSRLTEKTPYATLIFDCCHSGTIVRDAFGDAVRWVPPDMRPKEELLAEMVESPIIDYSGRSRDLGPKGASGWLPLGERYVLIAACRDGEPCYEYESVMSKGGGKVVHGALTFFLCKELVRAEASSYHDIFARAGAQVTAVYSHQHPQLEGCQNCALFGTLEIEPLRSISVLERKKNRATLGAGAAHGLTVSSQWAVYPSAIQPDIRKLPKLGLIELDTVSAVTSEAEILAEVDAHAISTGTQAVEEAHFYGEMRLKVDIQVPEDHIGGEAALTRLIKESQLLRRALNDKEADARVYIVVPRAEVQESDPVPELGPVIEPIWAVVGLDGRLLMPIRFVRDSWAGYEIRDNLERIARYRNMLALNNPDPNNLLKGKVDLILKRQMKNGSWEEATPELDGGQIIFCEGDRMAFQIVNRHVAPVYLGLFDLGLTPSVSLIPLLNRRSGRLEEGERVTIGVLDEERIELHIPNSFPYDEGVETLKLFAATEKIDFAGLSVQEGGRSTYRRSAGGSLLWELLDMALTGHGARDSRRTHALLDQDWTTVERSFLLRRRTQ